MKGIDENTTIGEIVADDFRTALVFAEHGIDFCCKGHQRFSEVCEKKKIDQNTLLRELSDCATSRSSAQHFNEWPLDRLIAYIESTHHAYIREQVPVIRGFMDKLCSVHGTNHPELFEVRDLFFQGSEHLLNHMMKEEKVLFPLINDICNMKAEAGSAQQGKIPVSMPVRMMEKEHEVEGDRFARIAEVTGNYSLPADGCTTYRVTYAMLRDFEMDLHKHIHLENNILFPKAIELESSVK